MEQVFPNDKLFFQFYLIQQEDAIYPQKQHRLINAHRTAFLVIHQLNPIIKII